MLVSPNTKVESRCYLAQDEILPLFLLSDPVSVLYGCRLEDQGSCISLVWLETEDQGSCISFLWVRIVCNNANNKFRVHTYILKTDKNWLFSVQLSSILAL